MGQIANDSKLRRVALSLVSGRRSFFYNLLTVPSAEASRKAIPDETSSTEPVGTDGGAA